MSQALSRPRTDLELFEANRLFYDALWSDVRLVQPERFNTWPLVSSLAVQSRRRLEVAPGLRPRFPLQGTLFVDISAPALSQLRDRGANGIQGRISSLPFPDSAFDLVCALDIIEHVDDDELALSELSRVTEPGGALLISTPLHPSHWTAFDEFVGHRRRYEPTQLAAMLAQHGLSVERSAVHGMRPRSSWLVDFGMWAMIHRRKQAMFLYNHVMMPLAVRFEKTLTFAPGMIETADVDEVLLLCRKA